MPHHKEGSKLDEVQRRVTDANREAESKELSDEDLENVSGGNKIIGIDLGPDSEH